MAYISKRNRTKEKDRQTAARNRGELIAAGFKRRALLKMGLLTSAGLLIPKKGLSKRLGYESERTDSVVSGTFSVGKRPVALCGRQHLGSQ